MGNFGLKIKASCTLALEKLLTMKNLTCVLGTHSI